MYSTILSNPQLCPQMDKKNKQKQNVIYRSFVYHTIRLRKREIFKKIPKNFIILYWRNKYIGYFYTIIFLFVCNSINQRLRAYVCTINDPSYYYYYRHGVYAFCVREFWIIPKPSGKSSEKIVSGRFDRFPPEEFDVSVSFFFFVSLGTNSSVFRTGNEKKLKKNK